MKLRPGRLGGLSRRQRVPHTFTISACHSRFGDHIGASVEVAQNAYGHPSGRGMPAQGFGSLRGREVAENGMFPANSVGGIAWVDTHYDTIITRRNTHSHTTV